MALMIGALGNAISGLRFFSSQAEAAARSIVNAGMAGQVPSASADRTVNGRPVTGQPAQAAPAVETPDMVSGVVQLKQAEIGYKASAKLAAALSDMHRQVIDILK